MIIAPQAENYIQVTTRFGMTFHLMEVDGDLTIFPANVKKRMEVISEGLHPNPNISLGLHRSIRLHVKDK